MPCPDCSPTADYERVELVWPGKGKPVDRVSLPFQTIERVNDVRRSRDMQAGLVNQTSRAREKAPPPPPRTVEGGADTNRARSEGVARYDVVTGRADLPEWWVSGWRNRLVWGDNAQVLSSLLDEFAGKVDLIYIDPPFATQADFTYRVQIGEGDGAVEKLPSMMEEVAYRDMWHAGFDSYIPWLSPVLRLLHDIASDDASLYVHCDATCSHVIRETLQANWGRDIRREIIWQMKSRSGYKSSTANWVRDHETILYTCGLGNPAFNTLFEPYSEEYIRKMFKGVDEDGRRYRERDNRRYYEDEAGIPLGDLWTDISSFQTATRSREYTGYPTQKPEALLERIIEASSNPGDLVLDCFVGSGTTAAVAEKLGRRWIAVDIGRFAIQTTRKRLLDIPGCRPFEVQNLGSYERKYWQLPGSDNYDSVAEYVSFILDLYEARPSLHQHRLLHGVKDGRAVHVGPTDAPVTREVIEAAIQEADDAGFARLDVLGWEFEMGIYPNVTEKGIHCYRIPREVLDKRNVDAGGIHFFELSVAEARLNELGNNCVSVKLTYFMPAVDDYMKKKLTKMPENEFDWIDYWSVDFEYDGEVFVNQWQAYRTRNKRKLALVSDPHEYQDDLPKSIVVKIIDTFGNDTTVQLERSAN